MAFVTLVVPHAGRGPTPQVRQVLAELDPHAVDRVILVGPAGAAPDCRVDASTITTDQPLSGPAWQEVLDRTRTPVLVCVHGDAEPTLPTEGLARMAAVLLDCRASLVYSDYLEDRPAGPTPHLTIDYQLGSIRDAFDFGPVTAWSTTVIRDALARFGPLTQTTCGALYDLRLRVSTIALPLRVPEPLYRCRSLDARPSGQQLFDYVDPRNRSAQIEMERIATEHLRRIGAYLPPAFSAPPTGGERFPLEASVIIPVRNRRRTIADAVQSACAQETSFAFNVIVVDNHSTDGTTEVLQALAAGDPRVILLVPGRHDLGIGGCWNLAAASARCGRCAAQLDSDDLYAGPDTLQRIVDTMNRGPFAMVVGAYRMVDFDLEEIPPGLIDHREWTRDNGRNNLLRVNGIGAPRAFRTSLLRACPMPNVCYGEDYAVSLRLSREYEVGRIFDPIYLCRRWEGNSDADLPAATKNLYDTYKDRLRTLEILARQRIVAGEGAIDT